MTLPALGLLAGHTDTTHLAPLVVALRVWCRPHAIDAHSIPPAALFATSPTAIGLTDALTGRLPVGIVAGDGEHIPERTAESAAAIVVRDARVAADLGDVAILWPRHAVTVANHPSLSAFVRRRWRDRLHLPSPLIVEIGTPHATAIADLEIPAALALCSAAVVRGPWLTTALALGTAVVTDANSAAAIGALAGVHVTVATPHEAGSIARALADDPARAAALGWGGRLLVEEHFDIGRTALEIVSALGLGPQDIPEAPLARLDAELDALGTPTSSSVANRVLRRAAGIAGPADWADLTGRRR